MKNFRAYKGKWIIKEHDLTSGTSVSPGDLIMYTSGGVTVDAATSAATNVLGISQEPLASDSTSSQKIKVLQPAEKLAEMIGPVTSGAIAAGKTDAGRSCDVNDYEGVAVDTDTEHHLTIVKGTKATTDGSSTEGEGVFRIAQTIDELNAI